MKKSLEGDENIQNSTKLDVTNNNKKIENPFQENYEDYRGNFKINFI